jgi:hypothetical protein
MRCSSAGGRPSSLVLHRAVAYPCSERLQSPPVSQERVHRPTREAFLYLPRRGVGLLRTGYLGTVARCQQEDGSVVIPEVVRPFIGGRERIVPCTLL